MCFIIVGLDRQLARARGRDLVVDDVLLPRAREAREAPGACCGERARQDEAARRHRAAFFGVQLLYALVMARMQPRVSQYGELVVEAAPQAFDDS